MKYNLTQTEEKTNNYRHHMSYINNIQNIDFSKSIVTDVNKCYVVLPLDHHTPKKLVNFQINNSFVDIVDDKKAHIFPGLTARQLKTVWETIMRRRRDRTTIVDNDDESLRICYCHKSKFFGFRDYITVQFIDVRASETAYSSTFALYSSGGRTTNKTKNKKRMNEWLSELHVFVASSFLTEEYRERIISPCTP
jgi:hypothetical protein